MSFILLRQSRFEFRFLYCLSGLILPIWLTSFAMTSNAATLSPADQIRLDSAVSKCSEHGKECPKLQQNSIENIEYLSAGEESNWGHADEAGVLLEDGLLVSYIQDSEDEVIATRVTRFFPLSKVELSPDSEYYMCPKGGEFKLIPNIKLEELSLDPMVLSSVLAEGFQPTSFLCKCFWAPESLFKELNIDKKNIPRPPIPPDSDNIHWPDSPLFPPVLGRPIPPGIIIGNPRPIFDRTHFIPLYPYDPYTPTKNSTKTNPPPPLAPVPVGGKCGLFPWKCAVDAVVDLIKSSNP